MVPPKIRECILNLRRHRAATQPINREKLFVTMRLNGDGEDKFPINIDGKTQVVTVRKGTIEGLGFKLIVKDN